MSPPMMATLPHPGGGGGGLTSSPEPQPMDPSSSSSNNMMYNNVGAGGSGVGGSGVSSGPQSFDSKDGAETTPQFKPRSHYAQPYYQSTSGGGNHLQQQQPSTSSGGGGGNVRNSIGQTYPRNSLTPETRQNSLADYHPQSQHQQQPSYSGYNQNNVASSQPPQIPSRSIPVPAAMNDQYPGAGNQQPGYSGGGSRRSFAQNSSGGGGGGMPTQSPGRQSLIDRSYHRNDNGSGSSGGLQHRESMNRANRPGQYDGRGGSGDDDTDSAVLRRNTKYVNRESLYSFQQVTNVERLIGNYQFSPP